VPTVHKSRDESKGAADHQRAMSAISGAEDRPSEEELADDPLIEEDWSSDFLKRARPLRVLYANAYSADAGVEGRLHKRYYRGVGRRRSGCRHP
jgi:hypothetical protein